jgi:hypothetical protein
MKLHLFTLRNIIWAEMHCVKVHEMQILCENISDAIRNVEANFGKIESCTLKPSKKLNRKIFMLSV